MSGLILTTSWDDGAPEDLRLAEILARHGLPATFFVPLANIEGRPVLSPVELRGLASAGFEIGGHGMDHRRLSTLDPAALRRQVVDGKSALEDLLGRPVTGFCYPGGRWSERVLQVVREAGFLYARTTAMGHLSTGRDPFLMPTTMQVFPHQRRALLRNALRNAGRPGGRGAALLLARLAGVGDFDRRLELLIQRAARDGGVLHLWGHAWEIDAVNLWPYVDRLFAALAELVPSPARRVNAGLWS